MDGKKANLMQNKQMNTGDATFLRDHIYFLNGTRSKLDMIKTTPLACLCT